MVLSITAFVSEAELQPTSADPNATAAEREEEEPALERRRRAAEERVARDADRLRLEGELRHMLALAACLVERNREGSSTEAATRRCRELQAELARLEAREQDLRELELESLREREGRRRRQREDREIPKRSVPEETVGSRHYAWRDLPRPPSSVDSRVTLTSSSLQLSLCVADSQWHSVEPMTRESPPATPVR
jgi:hypothetical protein